MNKRTIAVTVLSLGAIALVGCASSGTGSVEAGSSEVSAGDGSPSTSVVVQSRPEGQPFDPVAAALGVRNEEDFDALQRAQSETAIRVQDAYGRDGLDSRFVTEYDGLLDEVQIAKTDLYERAALAPGIEEVGVVWQRCMAEHGTPHESTETVEETIASGLSDADFETLVANRDECDRVATQVATPMLEKEYPAWVDEYRELFSRYAEFINFRPTTAG